MRYILKHILIFREFFNISWKTSVEYMNDFFIIILDFFSVVISTILFWKILLFNYDTLGIWNLDSLILLSIFGISTFSMCEIFAGTWQISEKIINGRIDMYICKPINPIIALFLEDMQIEEFLKGVINFTVLIAWYFLFFEKNVYAYNFILSIFSMIIGIFLISMIRAILSCFSFWVEHTNAFDFLIHMEDLGLEKYPLSIFNKYVKFILLTVIPVGFISSIPVMILLNTLDNIFLWICLELLFLFFLVIILKFEWKLGIKKYESTNF